MLISDGLFASLQPGICGTHTAQLASRARLKGSRPPSVRSKALATHSGNAKQRPWKSGKKWKGDARSRERILRSIQNLRVGIICVS